MLLVRTRSTLWLQRFARHPYGLTFEMTQLRPWFNVVRGSLVTPPTIKQFNIFLRRSRPPLTDELHCVCFIIDRTVVLPSSDSCQIPSLQAKGLQHTVGGVKYFLNDLVTDSYHLGRAKGASTSVHDHGGSFAITRSARLRTQMSRLPSALSAVKDLPLG
jgi:hypothetical protein